MSKGQQRRIEDLEEIIAHLHTEVELKDYWIETLTNETNIAQAVREWKSERQRIVKLVGRLAESLGKVMDIVEEEE